MGSEGDTIRYRCHHPKEQLARHGVRTETRFWSDPHLFGDVLDYDVFILHRVMYAGLIPDLIDVLHKLGKAVIFDTDDLVFDPAISHYDSRRATLGARERRRYQHNLHLHSQTLDHCDYALTTTRFLAEQLRRRDKQTFVSRNSLNDEQARISEAAYRSSSPPKDQVVIGYFSGSPSHERDFAIAAPALLRLMKRYPQVHLRIFGHLSLDDQFACLGERVQRVPYMAWQELPYAIRQVNINIAPLELDNPFCQSKSEVKYIEAGAVGVPTVASPTEAFRFAITHGENGLLASTTREWSSCLESLVMDAAKRQQIGTAAHRHVMAQYTSAVRGAELESLLNQIWQDWRKRSPIPSESRPARRVIDQMIHCLSSLIIIDDLAQAERDTICLANELSLQQRHPGYRLWAWVKRQIKNRLHLTYEHEFFNQAYVLSPELTAGTKQVGHFMATQPNLYRLDIPFATHGRANTPDVILHLQTSPNAREDLATIRAPGPLLRDNQPYRFIFEPISDSQGHEFYFCLESPGACTGNAFSPWMDRERQQPAFAPRYRSGDTTF